MLNVGISQAEIAHLFRILPSVNQQTKKAILAKDSFSFAASCLPAPGSFSAILSSPFGEEEKNGKPAGSVVVFSSVGL